MTIPDLVVVNSVIVALPSSNGGLVSVCLTLQGVMGFNFGVNDFIVLLSKGIREFNLINALRLVHNYFALDKDRIKW